jgi:hypothetical protein
MRVYNLTDKPLDYRGRTIPPSGGFVDFLDLAFIPDRDLKLQSDRVLSFGRLPTWFETQQRIRRVAVLADEVTGEFLLSPSHLPGMAPSVLKPEDVIQVLPEDTLVPIPVKPASEVVEKKLGRRKK